jgi:hypothetical protein
VLELAWAEDEEVEDALLKGGVITALAMDD